MREAMVPRLLVTTAVVLLASLPVPTCMPLWLLATASSQRAAAPQAPSAGGRRRGRLPTGTT